MVSQVAETLGTNPPRYLFLHLADLDIMGHWYGWGSGMYRYGLQHLDLQLARILAVIDAHPLLAGRTAIVLTADHGGGDRVGSHVYADAPTVYTIPLVIWGPGVSPGLDLYSCFGNRWDPGTQYLDYNAPRQPLHNGDSGNLALKLLGLPTIPGSCLIPVFVPRLNQAITNQGLEISWQPVEGAFVLEQSETAHPGTWIPISGVSITQDHLRRVYQTPIVPAQTSQFFRLIQAP